MALKLKCISDSDRLVLEYALKDVIHRKYIPTELRVQHPKASMPSIKDGARQLLKELSGTPPCEEGRFSDVENVAYLIVNDLRRGEDAEARSWYEELQGKKYTHELEDVLRTELTVDEYRRLKGGINSG